MKKLIISLIFLLTLVTSVFAGEKTFTKYTGKTSKDIELAKTVYEMGKKSGVVAVEVEESIMIVHVTQALYRNMFYDRVSGNSLMRSWHKLIAQHYSKHNIGTVWLYVSGQKVAECINKGFFATEVVVRWLDD